MARLLSIDITIPLPYNLVQAFLCWCGVVVHRNDALDVAAAEALTPTHLCISPVRARRAGGRVHRDDPRLRRRIPSSGLPGHQAIAEAFGGEVGACAAPDARQEPRPIEA